MFYHPRLEYYLLCPILTYRKLTLSLCMYQPMG
jgi:hypothetical protein